MGKKYSFDDMLAMKMQEMCDYIPQYCTSLHGKTRKEVMEAYLDMVKGELAALEQIGGDADNGAEDWLLRIELFKRPITK